MARSGRRLRLLVRWGVAAGVPTAVALVAGGAAAGAVVVVGGLAWGLWRWPRWEARLFGSQVAPVDLRERAWVPPHDSWRGDVRLGPDGHRAFARALHAVTAAYLAECEREAER